MGQEEAGERRGRNDPSEVVKIVFEFDYIAIQKVLRFRLEERKKKKKNIKINYLSVFAQRTSTPPVNSFV